MCYFCQGSSLGKYICDRLSNFLRVGAESYYGTLENLDTECIVSLDSAGALWFQGKEVAMSMALMLSASRLVSQFSIG